MYTVHVISCHPDHYPAGCAEQIWSSGVNFTHTEYVDVSKYIDPDYWCGADYAEGFRQCWVYLKGTTKRHLP